ncbi:branched-chain amino acid transport system substrate-binding protein [Anoxybacillus voinovskiensis]|uniref:Branched-chain amino acid transport system substrate-binding protein n=1 Tax=Anoxybacteroides voinovskiense TaxID=230470 RepID=A0A840DRZ0_9BACL|nr:ABC transporter substrate-binding protein [Anoxybacillus voinovskiensis]MBB4074322.1 branched-chain amino acid transport system substrate-binding protein [Anoxybacillus voinovskiensis]GGJ69402.1 branched-chain amino acid ABC transporter substrate-binding protein [Anoxybacillus voinovskiensis]
MKKWVSIFVTCLLVFLLAACTSSQETSGKKEEAGGGGEIKIGAIFDTSGVAAPLGKGEMDTVQMLADQINEKGGINGKKIKLIAIDSKSDQNQAVLAMKKVIEQEKVVAVIGGTTSGNSLAMLPIAMKAQIPFISAASSKQINAPDDGAKRDWVFKVAQGDDVVMPKVLDFLTKKGWKKIAWLNVATSYGTSGHAEFQRLVKNYDLNVVIEDEFEATVNDAKAMLTRVKKENPDAIIVWGTVQETSVVVKNIRELGMNVPILGSNGLGSKQFIELAGDAANGVYFPAGKLPVIEQIPANDAQKEVITTYKKAFEEKFGYPASTFGGHAYDGFMMLTKAIEAKGTDPKAIKTFLENMKEFVGVTGIFKMSENDHNGLNTDSLVMIEIQNGQWKITE